MSEISNNSENLEMWSERMDGIMNDAVEKAIEENGRLGIHLDCDDSKSIKVAEDS